MTWHRYKQNKQKYLVRIFLDPYEVLVLCFCHGRVTFHLFIYIRLTNRPRSYNFLAHNYTCFVPRYRWVRSLDCLSLCSELGRITRRVKIRVGFGFEPTNFRTGKGYDLLTRFNLGQYIYQSKLRQFNKTYFQTCSQFKLELLH